MTWAELLKTIMGYIDAGMDPNDPARIAILRGERTWTLATSYEVGGLAQSPRGNVYMCDTVNHA